MNFSSPKVTGEMQIRKEKEGKRKGYLIYAECSISSGDSELNKYSAQLAIPPAW
jgi:hypothetical protein